MYSDTSPYKVSELFSGAALGSIPSADKYKCFYTRLRKSPYLKRYYDMSNYTALNKIESFTV